MREVQELQNKITSGTSTWTEALVGGVDKFSASVKNLDVQIQDLVSSSLTNFSSGAANAFLEMTKGTKSAKDAFRDFTTSFLLDVQRQIMQTVILAMVKKAAGLLVGGIGAYMGGGEVNQNPSAWGGQSSPMMHGGGIAGEGGFAQRQTPSYVFAMAPRFHSGLMSDEVPAILQKGERVIPKSRARESQSPVTNLNLSVIVNAKNAKLGSEIQRELEESTIRIVERKLKEYS
jgi:hypothetical protein